MKWMSRLAGSLGADLSTSAATRTVGWLSTALGCLLLACASSAAADSLEPALLVRERAHVPLSGCRQVVGTTLPSGRMLAIVSCLDGVHIFDVDNPDAPQELAALPGSGVTLAADGGLLFAAPTVFDVRTPESPVALTILRDANGAIVYPHNVSFDAAAKALYLAPVGGPTLVYGLANFDPDAAPSELRPEFDTGRYDHDVVGRTYTIWGTTSDVLIFDHDESPPYSVWAQHPGGEGPGFVHTVYPSADLDYAVIAKEAFGSVLDEVAAQLIADGFPVYGSGGNASNCWAPLTCFESAGLTLVEVTKVGSFPYSAAVRDTYFLPDDVAGGAHKPRVKGDYVYTAFYQAGLPVLRIDRGSDSFIVAGKFDTTQAEPDGNTPLGAWDVDPFLGEDRILIADDDTGLWIVEHTTMERLASYVAAL